MIEITTDGAAAPSSSQNNSASSPVPNSQPPASSPSAQPQLVQAKRNFKWLWLVLVLLIALGGYVLWQSGGLLQSSTTPESQSTDVALASPTPVATPSIAPYDRHELLFTTHSTNDEGTLSQFVNWMLDLQGGASTKMDLPEQAMAFKHPRSPLVFFTEPDKENMLLVKDLRTNQVVEHQLVSHSQLDVREGVAINGLASIAPDDSAVVYSVYFSEPCPSVTMPPDYQGGPLEGSGGFGPCEPEIDPSTPAGYYFYDLASRTNTFLGGVVLPAVWDLAGRKLYYNDIDSNRGLKVFDLESKQVSIFDQASTFGYGAFPLLRHNLLIKIEGQTGDVAGQTSSSTLSLVDQATGSKQVLDQGAWAYIQPFAAIAPDEHAFLYQKTRPDSAYHMVASLHIYDMASKAIRQLTPESDTSYSIHGYWPDNEHFITTATTFGSGVGSNYSTTHLVRVRLSDGLVTPLSTEPIFRFAQI